MPTPTFIHSVIHSYTHSHFIHSYTHSHFHSFAYPLPFYLLTHSFKHSFLYPLPFHSFIHIPTPTSFIYPLILHSFIHSFIRVLTPTSSIPSCRPPTSIHSSLIHSLLLLSLIHSFIHSYTRSVTPRTVGHPTCLNTEARNHLQWSGNVPSYLRSI